MSYAPARLRHLLVIVLLFGVSTAIAQPRDRAKIAYRKAVASYDFAEYQKALDLFKEAYAAFEEPAILFNIAQCHRQLGQKAEAILVYKAYLRNATGASNADEVRSFIARLEKALADEQATKPIPVAPVATTAPVLRPAPTVEASAPLATVTAKQSIHKRWYFWAGLVGGLVVVGVATGVAVALTPKDVGYPSGTREVRF